MSNPAIELERGAGSAERGDDRTRALTIAVWSFGVWAVLLLLVSGAINLRETQDELRLIPWLEYDERVDFAYFYAAADLVWHGDADELYPRKFEYIFYPGDPAYDATDNEYVQARLLARGSYYNPPLVAFLQSPLTTLGFKWGYWTFSAISVGALLIFLAALWRTGRGVAELPVVILGVLAFQPVHEAVIMGHLSLLFVLAMGCGFLLLRSNQPVAAGLMLSLLALKPQWAILPAVFLLFRLEWRALISMGLASAALVFIPFLVTGTAAFSRYIEFIRDQGNADLVTAPHMFSWNGFLSKLVPNEFLAVPTSDINMPVFYTMEALTVVAVVIIWLGRDFYLGVAATIIGMLLVSTHSVWYDWAFLAVAAGFLAIRPSPLHVRMQVWVLLVALFITGGQSVDAIFAPDGRHGSIHWSEAAFFSVTLVAFGILVWMAGRTVLEGLIQTPRFLKREPAPAG